MRRVPVLEDQMQSGKAVLLALREIWTRVCI